MLKTRQLVFIFTPATLLVAVFLFVRVVQYQPLFPKEDKTENPESETLSVPIFPDDPILGNKKAGIGIVAFEDFGCEACKEQTSIFEELISKYPDAIRIIWKGLPVTQFPHPTELAERYGYCANKQGMFDAFKNYAFNNSGNLSEASLEIISEEIKLNKEKLAECLESPAAANHIAQTKQIARILNIQAVPAIFVDGKQIDPPKNLEGWETLLGLSQ